MVFRRVAVRAAWGYLALVLLLAPLLGLMHKLVHGVNTAHLAAQTHTTEVDGGGPNLRHAHDHTPAHGHHWLSDLFSAHGQDTDCRVFDQLNHSDILPAWPQLLGPMLLPVIVLVSLKGEALARWAALFEARGPPLPR